MTASSPDGDGRAQAKRPRWKVVAPDMEAPRLPEPLPLRAAKQAILDRWPDKLRPPKVNLDQLVAEMLDRVNRWDFRSWTIARTLDAAHACFDSQRRERPDLAPLRQFYANEIAATTSESFLDGMMLVYIGSFVPSASHTRQLGRALNAARARLGSRWANLLKAVPGIFDGESAPTQIAGMMTHMRVPWEELPQIDIRSPHAPGLMDHVHRAYVALIAPGLREPREVDKLLAWMKPEGEQVRSSGGAEVIQALLSHWISSEPPEALRKHLVERLTELFGDPRMYQGAAWAGVKQEAIDIFLRWITGANIDFFMDVLSQVESSRMWAPRRRFWMQLYKQGRIDAAWVAFSGKGDLLAQKLMKLQGRRSGLEFGRQVARADTSLLILKSGNKIIVEGSHSYRIHIFRDGETEAPRLYQKIYDCDDIMRKSDRRTRGLSKAHQCLCANGGYPSRCPGRCAWQDWVNENI
ncbi:EH signature domain-containing protein [Oryzibacter oryziterrae]|uniref:EH signature domain-containing protein n=1 Tax=Oryzibacter oryziterrae TaxID=2766474 RepID=UPI001F4494E5|nr:EH signature domain-containing protein [Oryzibacter oryziterrae]